MAPDFTNPGSKHRANMHDASITALEGVLDPMRRAADHRFRLTGRSWVTLSPTHVA